MPRTGPEPLSQNTHELVTERLSIDLPRLEDAPQMFLLTGGPDRREVCSTLLWDGPDEVEDVEGWIERCRTQAFKDGGFHWVVRDLTGEISGEEQRVVGAIGTEPRGWPGRADVGYWLGRPYWGAGIMIEALGAVLAFGFETLDYAKVEAEVFIHNRRGLRLVEEVGMKREGVIRQAVRKYDEWVDEAIYGLLYSEWVAASGS